MKIFWLIFLVGRISFLSFTVNPLEAKMVNLIEKIYLTPIGEPRPCTQERGEIELDLKKLIPSLKDAYHCEVEIIPGFSDLSHKDILPRKDFHLRGLRDVEFAYNKKRKQYSAPLILQELEKLFSNQLTNKQTNQRTCRLVGIIDQDLYDEGLNFIFGEAIGQVTIVSLWRFKPCTKITTEVEEKILLDRTIKTVIHELGHTLGLGHCTNRKCVMFFSNWLGDTDYKEKTFCEKCQKKLW